MKAAPKPEPDLRATLPTEDARRLERLSTIHASLLHCERSEAAIRAEFREQQQLEVGRLEVLPLLQQLIDTREKLHRDAGEARQGLSPAALKLYEGMLRLKKLPFVARIQAGSCGECHLKLPSALAGTVSDGSKLSRCPLCGRVLLAAPSLSS